MGYYYINYVKIDNDKYILTCKDPNIFPSFSSSQDICFTFYTPTHIYTFPNGSPNDFKTIKEIHFTKSNVIFTKDINTKKCCIDIYDDKTNINKCRIIGLNGHFIYNTDRDTIYYEVYEVSREAYSFVDNKPRTIYITALGLFIVSKKEYPNLESFDSSSCKGEVIEISAIDGKINISGFKNSNNIFNYNCPRDEPVQFEVKPTPIMEQIEKIAGIKIITPPSDQEALHRIAEILKIPVELLVIQNKTVYIISPLKNSPICNFYINNDSSNPRFNQFSCQCILKYELNLNSLELWTNYVDQLKKFLPIIKCNNIDVMTQAKACGVMESKINNTYILPDENYRKETALKPWPKMEYFDPFMKQIEKITGIKPNTPPPNEEVAIKLVSKLLDIPKELLIIIDGKIYLRTAPKFNGYLKNIGLVDNIENAIHNLKGYYWNCEASTKNKNYLTWIKYIDLFKSLIPPIVCKLKEDDILKAYKLFNEIVTPKFDNSEEAKEERKRMVLTPWNEI